MKTLYALIPLAAVALLSGCAVPAGPGYARAVPVHPNQNPYEWHTVSVTPVAPGSRVVAGAEPRVEYSTEPVPAQPRVVYTTEPLYPASPVYGPVYTAPPAYYYPPVTIGLDFVFGNFRHRGRRH
ncbi:hypothetical protein [Pseudoduganella namucuonensis]|uniref:Lipoprotein n=1 Tax=Pseudoduganella namucuonensis TaxID=1035707 RepID=A0A1I7LLK9_9BURK|nr:hypothetical protein [Pseudoduganella namucuonensis]SFV10602.1 hypothetical protein SAMN05216552_103210 [Pseudoduganella namucuonensis]